MGIDGGGGFLKICLSIFEFEPNSQPAKHACFKNSGVKKLLIVGLAPSVQENYTNLRKLWIILGLHKLQHKYTIATDLKLCNILLGIMAHGSSHPCCWCNASKNYLQYIGERRTLKSLETNFWNFFDDGREKKKAKQFDNVIHPSIVNHENKMTPVLNLVPPPELHLLVGTMNTLYKGLNNEWSDSANWLKACHVEREYLHGGSFTGNTCKILLSKIDQLQTMCPLSCLKYCKVLRSFSKVSIF